MWQKEVETGAGKKGKQGGEAKCGMMVRVWSNLGWSGKPPSAVERWQESERMKGRAVLVSLQVGREDSTKRRRESELMQSDACAYNYRWAQGGKMHDLLPF